MREDLKVWLCGLLMRQFVCLRIAPAGEIKGSAFIFRVNGLKVVGQKNGRTMGSFNSYHCLIINIKNNSFIF
jgi:hypothetical protein